MSCFIVPLTQAVATTIIRKRNEKNTNALTQSRNNAIFRRYLPALEKMLWGGSLMLVVDHVMNGEVTWQYPFFTALEQTGGASIMLREMLTVGVPMSLVLTAAWVIYAHLKERRQRLLSTH